MTTKEGQGSEADEISPAYSAPGSHDHDDGCGHDQPCFYHSGFAPHHRKRCLDVRHLLRSRAAAPLVRDAIYCREAG
ncbi:hypothetical protein D3C76_1447690 [compost metagenome]